LSVSGSDNMIESFVVWDAIAVGKAIGTCARHGVMMEHLDEESCEVDRAAGKVRFRRLLEGAGTWTYE
ncbi:hypothetical protein KCV00_g347, partial [Aureobasidium melanogenum]